MRQFADSAIEAFSRLCKEFEPVGSRITVNPTPQNTDIDYLALLGWFSDAEHVLKRSGFFLETRTDYGSMTHFRSWRKGDVNIIVTYRRSFFDAFMAATHVAKRLNLREKADRVALFQAVLYRNKWGA